MTKYRRAAVTASGSRPPGEAAPLVLEATFSPITNTNNFGTSTTASGTLDLSDYDAEIDRALVVAICWYANGGGALTYNCTYAGVPLTQVIAQDRSDGANYGAGLFIMQNPPSTGSLVCGQIGASNTGRNVWGAAMMLSGVGSWSVGSAARPASGVAHEITIAEGDLAVSAQAAGQTMAGFTQTSHQASTVGNVRARLGSASGAGVKNFSCTGGGFNSVLAKLAPVG